LALITRKQAAGADAKLAATADTLLNQPAQGNGPRHIMTIKEFNPMNDRIRRRIEMLTRVVRFGGTYAGHFPPASRGGELFTLIESATAHVESRTTTQAASQLTVKQQTVSKGLVRDRLTEEMEAINLTARAIVGKVSGLENRFRMPHNVSGQDLLTAARVFAQDAQTFKAEFVRRAMPETFVEDLNGLILEYSEALADREQSAGARVSATVARDEAVEQAMDAVRELNAVVRNTLRGDRAALAEWQSASHIERPPQRRKDAPPPAAGSLDSKD
jgi:hypothetical protein